MSIKSMTGFGSSSSHFEQWHILSEVSSVNKKNLEISISLPRELQSLELPLANSLRNSALRGKISVSIKVSLSSNPTQDSFFFHHNAVSSTLQQIQSFCHTHNVPFSPTPHLILDIARTLNSQSSLPDPQSIFPSILQTTLNAVNQTSQMRLTEGLALASDLTQKIHKILTWISPLHSLQSDAISNYSSLLLDRLKKYNLQLDLNDERVLKEIALFADRSDISEEITRLHSHLQQFLSELSSPSEPSIGRKLDFLCQEIHRELNTINSKSPSLPITQIALNSKNILEAIREQSQNIE